MPGHGKKVRVASACEAMKLDDNVQEKCMVLEKLHFVSFTPYFMLGVHCSRMFF